MRHANGAPILIDGQPVEFQPAFQLGVLKYAVARFLEAGREDDRQRLEAEYGRVAWYQRAAYVAQTIRRAGRAAFRQLDGATACSDCGHRADEHSHVGTACAAETGRDIGPGYPGQRDETIVTCECPRFRLAAEAEQARGVLA